MRMKIKRQRNNRDNVFQIFIKNQQQSIASHRLPKIFQKLIPETIHRYFNQKRYQCPEMNSQFGASCHENHCLPSKRLEDENILAAYGLHFFFSEFPN